MDIEKELDELKRCYFDDNTAIEEVRDWVLEIKPSLLTKKGEALKEAILNQKLVPYLCEVCMVELKRNNIGQWWCVVNCNGDVSHEYSCPLILCDVCVSTYDSHVSKVGISSATAKERYDGFCGNKGMLIQTLKLNRYEI